MRELRTAAAVLGSLTAIVSTAAIGPARADEKGDALLKEVAAQTKATEMLTADIEMSAKTGERTVAQTGKLTLQRPNLVRMELAPAGQVPSFYSDGTNVWVLMDGGKQYQKMDANPEGKNLPVLWGAPIAYFFDQKPMSFNEAPAATKYLGVEKVGDTSYEVVEMVSSEKDAPTIKLYVGPDKRLHRSVVSIKRGDRESVYSATLKNIKVGAAQDVKTFAYTPPATARPYERPNFEANLVKVGDMAPGFSLPTPTGGTPLSLSDITKGKKATLVNFWFYG